MGAPIDELTRRRRAHGRATRRCVVGGSQPPARSARRAWFIVCYLGVTWCEEEDSGADGLGYIRATVCARKFRTPGKCPQTMIFFFGFSL